MSNNFNYNDNYNHQYNTRNGNRGRGGRGRGRGGRGRGRGNNNRGNSTTPQRRGNKRQRTSINQGQTSSSISTGYQPPVQQMNLRAQASVNPLLTSTPTGGRPLTRCDVLIGDVMKYLPNADALKHYKESVARQPKEVMRVLNNSCNFTVNKIDTQAYVVRTLVLFMDPAWYPLEDAHQFQDMLDDELADLITKIERTLDSIERLYNSRTNYLIIDEPLEFYSVAMMVGRKKGWVICDVNPINHGKLAEVSDVTERYMLFCDRFRHFIKYHYSDITNVIAPVSNEGVLNINDLY